jgi:hypothetical protein
VVALQWRDVDLEGRTARIRRSLFSGVHLGPTKTGRERVGAIDPPCRSAGRYRYARLRWHRSGVPELSGRLHPLQPLPYAHLEAPGRRRPRPRP